jgi:hypothetical protein
MGMFDFLLNPPNFEVNNVAHFEENGVVVDTCRVSDGLKPIETGVRHPGYNDGKWIIVEAYDSEEDAQMGHKRWVKKMTTAPLPRRLRDCQNSEVAQLLPAKSLIYPRKRR